MFLAEIQVECDECGDQTCKFAETRGEAWRLAREGGWKRIDRRHLCKGCAGRAKGAGVVNR